MRGGVAYQLVYTPPTGTAISYPEPVTIDGVTRSRFMWTSINNRTMGCSWRNYLMNCEEPTWVNTVKAMCHRFGEGIRPSGATESGVYSRLLLDVVMGVIDGHHNVIRPYELATDQQCRAANIVSMRSICNDFSDTFGDDFEIACNVADLGFLDAFRNQSDLANRGFAGVMDENITAKPDGELALANLLWKFRGHQYAHNIFKNDGAFHTNVWDRRQALVAFLMARDPMVGLGQEPRATFGYGEWTSPPPGHSETIPVFPEQMLNVGNVVGTDPFGSFAWPDLATWQDICGDNTEAANWLAANAVLHRQVSGRHYAAMRFELEDGLPNEMTEAAVVWDISPAGTPGVYTMESLFPEKAGTTWYALELDGTALLDGGVLSSSPVALNWPIPTIAHQATLYFTKPVHSPIVEPLALRTIPATGGLQGQLRIAASQWNGMPLAEVRVDGTSIGWGNDLLLTCDGDGIYTYTGTGTGTSVGVHHDIPVVATGTDGLRMYAKVAVEAAEDVVIAGSAKYSLLANSYDDKVVLALEIPNFVPISGVDVTAPDIFGVLTPTVALYDDGGSGGRTYPEDQVAGDGIYTSDRVAATLSAQGYYSAHVVVHLGGGGTVTKDVSVRVITSGAEFRDISGTSGATALISTSGAQPYAAAYANTQADRSGRNAMVVTFDDGGTPGAAPILAQRINSGTDPASFARKSDEWLGPNTYLPVHSRGVCFGDFDNDGRVDFFLCGVDSSVLYRNDGTANSPHFTNVTATAFPGLIAPRLAGAVSASWGDYDVDGDLDLYVATTDYAGPMSEIGQQTNAQFDALVYENKGGVLQRRPLAAPSSSLACLSGLWVDLIHNRKSTSLVLPWVADGDKILAYNWSSAGAGAGGFIVAPWTIEGMTFSVVNSVTVCDYDHDAYPDLLVTDTSGSGTAAILRNAYPSSGARRFDAVPIGPGRRWNGATVADFDGNGQDDILLLPQSGDPALYMALNYGTTASPPTYRDLAFTLGLRNGATSGAIAADMGGNRNADLYLGRGANRFLYDNVGAGTGSNRGVEVSLSTVGNSNNSLIGAEIIVERAGQRWTKLIDGGSGRGGQDPNSLQFYLGDDPNDVSVTVHYPSGDSDSATNVPVDGGVFTAVEDTPITLKVGTKTDPDPTYVCELGPGTMDWVFKWRTVGIKGDQRQDAVTIENYLGYTNGSACYLGFDSGTPLVLHWGDPGVSIQISWDGTNWLHELRWSGLPCTAGCQYRFKVTSGIGNGTTSTGPTKVMPAINFCLPDPDPNQQ